MDMPIRVCLIVVGVWGAICAVGGYFGCKLSSRCSRRDEATRLRDIIADVPDPDAWESERVEEWLHG